MSSLACGRQMDSNVFGFAHLKADHHERSEQEEHDVDERNDHDPRSASGNGGGQFHSLMATTRRGWDRGLEFDGGAGAFAAEHDLDIGSGGFQFELKLGDFGAE